jgi:hypothetical protein
MHVWSSDRRTLGRSLGRAQSRWWPLEWCLGHSWLWASAHAWSLRMVRVLVLHLLVLLVRHEKRLCRHWLLRRTRRMLLVG